MNGKKLAISIAIAIAFLSAAPSVAMAHQPVPKHGTHRQEINRAIIRKVGAEEGLCKADIVALDRLAYQESGWSSTPKTGRYGGLFQIDTKTGYASKRNRWKNPVINTRIAIVYIKKRYGTPRKALAHSRSHNWY